MNFTGEGPGPGLCQRPGHHREVYPEEEDRRQGPALRDVSFFFWGLFEGGRDRGQLLAARLAQSQASTHPPSRDQAPPAPRTEHYTSTNLTRPNSYPLQLPTEPQRPEAGGHRRRLPADEPQDRRRRPHRPRHQGGRQLRVQRAAAPRGDGHLPGGGAAREGGAGEEVGGALALALGRSLLRGRRSVKVTFDRGAALCCSRRRPPPRFFSHDLLDRSTHVNFSLLFWSRHNGV